MKKTFIIAEAGVNHNGSLELAKKMIDAAVESGADAVKFQTFKTEKIICRYAPKAKYQMNTTTVDESQFEMLKKLELDEAAHQALIDYCEKSNIRFLSTPFDFESIDLLNKLGLDIFKIPSGDITNLPYLRKIGALKKKTILSTGMADLGEIEDALDVLSGAGTKIEDITVLHCNTEYPTPAKDVNLFAMKTIADAFNVRVGYSDHTLGIEVPIAAVALGASVIEKHFTLDKNLPGPDHKASLDPNQLKDMVSNIRSIEKAFGDGVKKPSQSELNNREIVRKSIVAAVQISQGDVFTEKNLTVKRPGSGISPMRWDEILGKKASKRYSIDELIIGYQL
jgi:N,N'-diacetyllegionaminate synthase